MHTLEPKDKILLEQEVYRTAAISAVQFYLIQNLNVNFDYLKPLAPLSSPALNITQQLSHIRQLTRVSETYWEEAKNKKQDAIDVILVCNHQLTVFVDELFKKTLTIDQLKKIIDIKKVLAILFVVMNVETSHDLKLVRDKLIESKGQVNMGRFVYQAPNIFSSDSFKAGDAKWQQLMPYLNKLEKFVYLRYGEPNCSFSWFTRSDKIKIALESYDALIANIHGESLDFPLHRQGRLGDILSGIEFDLKNACPAVKFK